MNRHGHRGAVARARREYRDCRRHSVIAQVVEEDLPDPLLLRHGIEVLVRTVLNHLRADDVREILRHRPRDCRLAGAERCHDMQALAAGGLAERFQAGCLESIADFDGAGNDRFESNIRGRVQIEDQAAGHFGIAGRAVPGMKLERSDLCGRSERLDAIDLHVWRLVAAHFDGREKIRHAGRSVALKELFGADTIRQRAPASRGGP